MEPKETDNGPNASDKGFLKKLLDWLTTIQGIITTILAIIGSVIALVALVNPNGQHSAPPTPTPSPLPTASLQSAEVEFEIAYADQPAVKDHYLFLFLTNHSNVVYDLTFNALVQDVHLEFSKPMVPSGDRTNYWGHVEIYNHTANHVQIYGAMLNPKQGPITSPITARLTVTYLSSGDPIRLVDAYRVR
jgi:hypothetical protein